MTRRDAFSHLRDSDISEIETKNDNFQKIQPGTDLRQPLELIPTAQPRKKRKRQWEQAHRAETVTYRGIPLECHEWIGMVSSGLAVPRDEVVRAFLEYSLDLYRRGQLVFLAYPKARRMTLFPDEKNLAEIKTNKTKEIGNWLDEAFPLVHKKKEPSKKKKDQQDVPLWKVRVTYRIPSVLKEEIRTVSEEHSLPVGEVVWFFIEQALSAYQDGKLLLKPVPKVSGKTLFQR